ncbi:hypothetical protein D930_00379 [Enterococcus faecalis KI-6-1-110608-1]|nr:hypothetical protein D930_00379 [Enterococcus faecalis KI-6-1-110608-1]
MFTPSYSFIYFIFKSIHSRNYPLEVHKLISIPLISIHNWIVVFREKVFPFFDYAAVSKILWRFPLQFFQIYLKNDIVFKKFSRKFSFCYHLIFPKILFLGLKKGLCRDTMSTNVGFMKGKIKW